LDSKRNASTRAFIKELLWAGKTNSTAPPSMHQLVPLSVAHVLTICLFLGLFMRRGTAFIVKMTLNNLFKTPSPKLNRDRFLN
jgi:hypothetical protein